MPIDQPTYPGEAEFPLTGGTLTSQSCNNAALAIDDDTSTSASFISPAGYLGQGNGLNAVYKQDGAGNPLNSFEVTMQTQVDATIDWELYGSMPSFFTPGDGSIEGLWSGWIVPFYSETYTFTMDPGNFSSYVNGIADNGAAFLHINGQFLIDQNTTFDGGGPLTGSISLTGGVPYSINVNRSENENNFFVRLLWQSASQAKQVVPQSALFTTQPTLSTPRFLRVDFGQVLVVSRIRLGLSGAGAGNAGVALVLAGSGTQDIVVSGSTLPPLNGTVQDTIFSPPVVATGIVFNPDYGLNTTGLSPLAYPAVTINQLQVYQALPPVTTGQPVTPWSPATGPSRNPTPCSAYAGETKPGTVYAPDGEC